MKASSSAIQRGYRFERTTGVVLKEYFGFALQASKTNLLGGGDNGLDLVGDWAILRHPMVVGVQCKSLSSQIAVSIIRELESSLNRLPVSNLAASNDEEQGRLGIIASSTPLSLAARTWFNESKCMMLGLVIDELTCAPKSLAFNPTAREILGRNHGLSVVRQPKPGGRFDDMLVLQKAFAAIQFAAPSESLDVSTPKHVVLA